MISYQLPAPRHQLGPPPPRPRNPSGAGPADAAAAERWKL